MIQTVRVKTVHGPDLRGDSVLHDIRTMLHNTEIVKVETTKMYLLEGVTKQQAKFLTEKLFCETINQAYSINEPLINGAHHIVEIAYKPGVMNPEVASIIKAAKDLGITLTAADSSCEYGFYGKLSKEKIKEIVEKLNLYNKTVEHIVEEEPQTLLIQGDVGKTIMIPMRTMNDEELLLLSKDKLFLNVEEMKVIQKYFRKINRDPIDCELETIAQTWSEHCAHKTFKAKLVVDGKKKDPLISRLKKEALKHNKHIVSAFVDNSGVMDFYGGWAICGKCETHNSPSAIEPYGGAMTGSGGVFRDVLATGLGAKNIVSTDMFCFAPCSLSSAKLPPGCLPPNYLLKRVVAGVRDYGNRMGIPTNNGSVHFHNDFRAKPTVIVGAYGILPKQKAQKGKPKVGDLVVVVGGQTGRDGIHGATFSSAEMTDRTIMVNSSAVQIGNAIEEKRMFDAILEARNAHCIRAIQDCGAGGFSSAIGEMGQEIGVTVHLEKAPLKYQGLAPWEIWVSESQERMILAIPKNKSTTFNAVCKKYNVEVTNLGVFDGSKKLNVYYGKQKVCNLDMKFLHEGLPQRTMIARKITSEEPVQSPRRWPACPERSPAKSDLAGRSRRRLLRGVPRSKKEWIHILKKVLSHGNICSKEPIVRMYDHSVQGTNDLQPYSGVLHDGPNDAVVLRPLLDKPYGMIVSHGLNPILNRIDPYWGSIWAATEAVANYVAVGGNHKGTSLINNYIWPFPDEESLWSLDRSVDAVVDFMRALKIPVISGKDSLSSTYRGKDGTVIKIPPVLCISVFGKIPDISKTVTADFKKEGSVICFVGKMDSSAMGGSTYFDVFKTPRGSPPATPEVNRVPHVDLKLLPRILDAIYRGIRSDAILACHDISEGGLITTLFEMCIGGNMGVNIKFTSDGTDEGVRLLDKRGGRLKRSVSHDSSEVNRPDYLLFNETPGCFLIELKDERMAENLFSRVPHIVLGKTKREKSISVFNGKKELFMVDIAPLKRAWKKPMQGIFG